VKKLSKKGTKTGGEKTGRRSFSAGLSNVPFLKKTTDETAISGLQDDAETQGLNLWIACYQ